MPLPISDPDQAFAAGALVVTPNNRLARWLVARHDRAQLAAGRTVWPSARALPWNALLSTLWSWAVAADAFDPPPMLLDEAQQLHLWERAVAADNLVLLDSRGAAELAAQAWRTFHAYAEPGETFAALAVRGDDAATFVRWGRRYEASCTELSALDTAMLGERLLAALASGAASWVRGRAFVCVGFVDTTPVQARLLAALAANGADVAQLAWPAPRTAEASARSRAQFITTRDEMAAALQWAAAATAADPQAVVGIAVADLSTRVAEVSALADDILCPQVYTAGGIGRSRPWDLSLGAPLANHPLVVPALDILALASGALAAPAAAALARSPFLLRATALSASRALAELQWREHHVHTVTLRRFQAALPAQDPLRDGLDAAAAALRLPATASPADWAAAFRAALAAAGWPGDAALASETFQARDAWDHALANLAALAVVEPRMRRSVALASLRGMVARTLFQPERPGARIHIVGLLEAAGLTFDRLWLAGVAADAWPPPVQADALLPPSWQRAHGYAPADPLLTLERARQLTAQLAAGAPQVMASHVLSDDDPPRPVSPLCAWPLAAAAVPLTLGARLLASAPALDLVRDGRLPAVAASARTRGGVRVVELQSDCPFRAAAVLRLDAEPWPRPAIGLSAMERGMLLHAALAAFWTDVRDHATLSTLAAGEADALRLRVASAVDRARSAIDPQRWQELPPSVAATEGKRLVGLITRWLIGQELPRTPFRVEAMEQPQRLLLGSLDLGLRIDRIDVLQTPDTADTREHLAIIDYKSGHTDTVAHWLLPRPVAPQAGLYALAVQAARPTAVIDALALAQVKAGALRSRGFANGSAGWQGLSYPGAVGQGQFVDLADITAYWQQRFTALADEFRDGIADVAPRAYPLPCKHCTQQALCRISAAMVAEALPTGDDAEDGA